MRTTIEPRQFVCTGCGWHIKSFDAYAHEDLELCFQCQWLAETKDTVERERLRRYLERDE